jgi:hypothetical protein
MDFVLEERRFIGSGIVSRTGTFRGFFLYCTIKSAHQYVYYKERGRDSVMSGGGAQRPNLRVSEHKKTGARSKTHNYLLMFIYCTRNRITLIKISILNYLCCLWILPSRSTHISKGKSRNRRSHIPSQVALFLSLFTV